eukprot:scaffold187309_cov13-Tisochrysis_lutea.AAC.1
MPAPKAASAKERFLASKPGRVSPSNGYLNDKDEHEALPIGGRRHKKTEYTIFCRAARVSADQPESWA